MGPPAERSQVPPALASAHKSVRQGIGSSWNRVSHREVRIDFPDDPGATRRRELNLPAFCPGDGWCWLVLVRDGNRALRRQQRDHHDEARERSQRESYRPDRRRPSRATPGAHHLLAHPRRDFGIHALSARIVFAKNLLPVLHGVLPAPNAFAISRRPTDRCQRTVTALTPSNPAMSVIAAPSSS